MIPEVDMMHNVVLLEDTWKNEKCREVEYALRCIKHLHCQFCMQIVWVFVALIQILSMVYIYMHNSQVFIFAHMENSNLSNYIFSCFGSAKSGSCMQQMLSAFFFYLGLHTMCVGLSVVLDNTHKKHIPMCQWKNVVPKSSSQSGPHRQRRQNMWGRLKRRRKAASTPKSH